MQKKPWNPPRLRELSVEYIRELERRHGVTLLGKASAGELEHEPLPKNGTPNGQA